MAIPAPEDMMATYDEFSDLLESYKDELKCMGLYKQFSLLIEHRLAEECNDIEEMMQRGARSEYDEHNVWNKTMTGVV